MQNHSLPCKATLRSKVTIFVMFTILIFFCLLMLSTLLLQLIITRWWGFSISATVYLEEYFSVFSIVEILLCSISTPCQGYLSALSIAITKLSVHECNRLQRLSRLDQTASFPLLQTASFPLFQTASISALYTALISRLGLVLINPQCARLNILYPLSFLEFTTFRPN